MAAILNGPIPGESLTREPGNSPWEQPPMYSTPGEAISFYFDKFEDEEAIDDILFYFEQGMPISTMVESITTTGVMEGYHTLDVSTIIAPVLHIYFKQLCETAGIKYDENEGPSDKEKKDKKKKERLAIMINNMLSEEQGDDEQTMGAPPLEEEETSPSATPTEAPPMGGNGLVPRG